MTLTSEQEKFVGIKLRKKSQSFGLYFLFCVLQLINLAVIKVYHQIIFQAMGSNSSQLSK